MKKRKFSPLTLVGVLLILISAVLAITLYLQSYFGAVESEEIVKRMEELLPDRSNGASVVYPNPNMPVLEIEDIDYVAMIEVPSFDIVLPVANDWDGDLASSPDRFCGSVYDNTMVIGGADTDGQFSFCDRIEVGATITVTDMAGAQFRYRVTLVERSDTAEKEWLVSSEHSLTLFCRDAYSTEYVAVRCS